jgi:hypothetical protein
LPAGDYFSTVLGPCPSGVTAKMKVANPRVSVDLAGEILAVDERPPIVSNRRPIRSK